MKTWSGIGVNAGTRWVAGMVCALGFLFAVSARAANEQKTFVVNGVSITFKLSEAWWGSYQLAGMVSNAASGWTMLVAFPNGQKVSSAWGIASFASDGSGKVYNNSWSAANGAFTMGVFGRPSGELPTAITFNGQPVGGGNRAPLAADDAATVTAGMSVLIDVLSNDSDPDGDVLTLSGVDTPSHGVAAVRNGKAYYQPNAGFVGTDAFSYSIGDGNGGSATARVVVTVAANVNLPPDIRFVSPSDGQIVQQTALSPLAIAIRASDSDGTVASTRVSVDGQVFTGLTASWTPSAFATYVISATATDDDGAVASASVSVTIRKAETPTPTGKKRTIAYFPQWDGWKGAAFGVPGPSALTQGSLDPSKYAVLNFSFFGVAKDGSLHSGDFRNKQIDQAGEVQGPAPLLYTDPYSSYDLALLLGETRTIEWVTPGSAEETRLKSLGYVWDNSARTWEDSVRGIGGSYPIVAPKEGGLPGLFDIAKTSGVKLMASIGGWSMCKHFPETAADPVKRARFVADCGKLIKMGFDGIDLDWEYPGPFDGMNYRGTSDDYRNFTLLVRDIRAKIGPDKLLSSCFSCDPAKLAGFEWAEIDKYLDFFNIMSYDIDGGWSDFAGHCSPLYAAAGKLSWDNTFKYLTGTLGLQAAKINMGMGFYGRGVIANGAAALGASTVKVTRDFYVDGPVLSSADWDNFKDWEGTPYYSFLKAKTGDWREYWDDTAKVPYRTKDKYFLSYENERSIAAKAQYVVDHGGGGVIVWDIFGDWDFSGATLSGGSSSGKVLKSDGVKTPLIDALNGVFNGTPFNVPPTARVVEPADKAVIVQETLSAIAIRVQAADADGAAPDVAIRVDGRVFTGLTASWAPSAYGDYVIVATATDSAGASAVAQVSVTVKASAAPAAPVAVDDSASLEKNESADIAVLANDQGTGIRLLSVEPPSHGTTTVSGTFVHYAPTADYVGTDQFAYAISDALGRTASGRVTVVIADSTPSPNRKIFTFGDMTVTFTLGPVWGADYQISGDVSGAAKGWKMVLTFPNGEKVASAWGIAELTSGAANAIQNNSWSQADGGFTLGVSGQTGGALPTTVSFNGEGGGGEEENQPPEIVFSSPGDGAVVTRKTLSPIAISIAVSDADGTVAASSIAVDGHTFDGVSAEWVPSAFGTFSIVATAVDNDGASSTATCSILVRQGDAAASLVKGWPDYIAMGAVTLTDESHHVGRPVDAIFKYDGDGGNGDRGYVKYPIFTKKTAELARSLTAKYGMKVMPVMVVYTAEMSGGTNFDDLWDFDNLVMHFVNLIHTCKTLNSYKTAGDPYPGSIVLNPDLLGMVQQNNLWGQIDSKVILVTNALNKAIYCVEHKSAYEGEALNALEIFAAMRSAPNVYSDWDVKLAWETYVQNTLLAQCPETPIDGVPTFENNFAGWVQATNYAVRRFAPDVTFGWQENVWSHGSSSWIHQGLTSAEIRAQIAAPTVKLWKDLGVYGGPWKPDFIVFDKYEMDVIGGPWLFNAKDLDSYLAYVRHVNEGLGGVPVMLWQIPGGHLQIEGGVDTRESHASTEPDYFFGDPDLAADLSNVKAYVPQATLDYLLQDGYDWRVSNKMAKARDANVFAILWGGGNTTSVGRFPSDDGGWLSNKILEYYRSPTKVSGVAISVAGGR